MAIKTNDIVKRYSGFFTKLYVYLRSSILLFENVEKHVPKKGLIYDIGCGYGLISLSLALSSENRKVIGLDLDKGRIDKANASISLSNLSFRNKDITKDIDLASCDCILMYDLLHHIPYDAQKKLLSACKSKLNNGGVLVVKDIDIKPRYKLFFTYILDKIMTRSS